MSSVLVGQMYNQEYAGQKNVHVTYESDFLVYTMELKQADAVINELMFAYLSKK